VVSPDSDLAVYRLRNHRPDTASVSRLMAGGPQRRASDHVHLEYWEESQQHRYEDRMASELQQIRSEVKKLADRILLLMGALGLLAFVLPIAAPFIRQLFANVP